MIFGTHNSLTGYPLLGWRRIFGFMINPLARCQNKTIDEQLKLGVRWFNLQVNLKGDTWYASHGIAWYNANVMEILDKLDKFAKDKNEKIYVQLYMDRHLLHHTDHIVFRRFAMNVMSIFSNIIFERVYDEQNDILILEDKLKNGYEIYWTLTWARNVGKKWYYYLPFPKVWRKRVMNSMEIPSDTEYLMVDYIG